MGISRRLFLKTGGAVAAGMLPVWARAREGENVSVRYTPSK